MRVLSKAQCQSMPIDEIQKINQWWTQQLKDTPQYSEELLKNNKVNILKFIKRHAPELVYQFEWVELSGSDRMKLKYSHLERPFYRDFSDGTNIDDSAYLNYYYPEE